MQTTLGLQVDSALGGRPPAVVYWTAIEPNQTDQQAQKVA